MKKLYTFNHQTVTTCNDFNNKFRDFLSFLKEKEHRLYALLNNYLDFNLKRHEFEEEFDYFFEYWLKQNFQFHEKLVLHSLDALLKSVKTTDDNFDELFAYTNLYKKLKMESTEIIYFYDITLKNEEEENVMTVIRNSEKPINTSSFLSSSEKILSSLTERGFLKINNERIYFTFKTKYCI